MSDCRLYLISPPDVPDGAAFAQMLDRVLGAGDVAAFQLRLKGGVDVQTGEAQPADTAVWRAVAPAIAPVCAAHGVAFILNDRADLVSEFRADGVHLGQSDGDAREVRAMLGGDAIVGVTCHNSRHLAMEAGEAGADYVAFGAFFPTDTKAVKHHADVEILTWWRELFELPAVAIGGVSVDNAQQLARAGADFVAVSAGVWGFDMGPEAAVAAFTRTLKDG